MALEKRNGNLYYYRSIRNGERVRKVYPGASEFARLVAEGDVLRRTGREAQRQRERAELERLEVLATPVLEVGEAIEVLARAHFVAAGYRRVKGVLRLRREQPRDDKDTALDIARDLADIAGQLASLKGESNAYLQDPNYNTL